jgi:outer membrane protein insertion porin family
MKICAGVESLKELGFFKEATLHPRPGSKPGNLHLIIRVVESYWPSLRFKGGYSELDGWYITPISLNLDNILGFGNSTSLDITFGDRITSINLNYINPNIFDSDFDFHFKMALKGHQYVHYIEGTKLIQQVPQGGYFFGLRSMDSFFSHFLFGWEVYATQPDSLARYSGSDEINYVLPEPIALYSKDKFLTSAFTVFFNWDKRIQKTYPIGGWWTGIWFTQSDKQLGSQFNFSRFIIDIRKYNRLFNQLVIAARVKYGFVSGDAPFYEKFYMGGPNSIRGYPDRSLSPVGGGDRQILAGLELRIPISKKRYPDHFLTGIIFLDTGTNIVKSNKLSTEQFKSSYGFGLRFRLPFIGLLRMDFAYPLENDQKRIHFSLGHTF